MDTASNISPAEFVIGRFGGLTATAKAIGKPVTTVQGWKERGRIPQEHWDDLIAAAKADGKTLDLTDFLRSRRAPSAGQAA